VRARPLDRALEERTVAALVAELSQRRAAFAGRRLATCYLGGGTPSLLRPASVARLVRAARDAFPAVAREPEVTLEANPSTLERARLPGFRDAGVNRLSVGIQSFDDRVLKRLGRAHRAAEGLAALEAARRAGFANLSLDLIFAVPGQDRASLRADLARAAALAPEHVSAYALTVEEGTPYARGVARGRLALPDDDTAAAMMEDVREALAAAGLALYEVSSYARPGYRSQHNRRYWRREAVLGIGLGAWSTEPRAAGAPFGARRANERTLEAWLARVEAGGPPPEPREVLGAATARAEAAFLGLRTAEGLRAAVFEAEFGAPPRAFFAPAIERVTGAGLAHESPEGDLRLTARGWLLADAVAAHFV
jgi:oxygen-independent coproporphyrinogen-3 oxidase